MPDYVVARDGVMETANGKSRVSKGQKVSLTDWEYAHNSHLFGVELPATVELVREQEAVKVVSVKRTPRKTEPVPDIGVGSPTWRKAEQHKSAKPAARASIKRR